MRASLRLHSTPKFDTSGSLVVEGEGISKSGELYVKSGSKWKRYVFVLKDDGTLSSYALKEKVNLSDKPKFTVNMLLCTVRPATDPKYDFCMDVISPQESIQVRFGNRYTYIDRYISILILPLLTSLSRPSKIRDASQGGPTQAAFK